MRACWILVALLLSACVNFSRLDSGQVVVGNRLSVTLDQAWNKWNAPGQGATEMWTRDGPALDTLVFYTGIKPGEPLAPGGGRNGKSGPRFRAGMPAHEIVEMYETQATQDGSAFKLEKLSPVNFLNPQGFRFDFSLRRKQDELAVRGVGFGAVQGGELVLMVFQAPKQHYFAKHLPSVEAIAQSARTGG